MAFGLHESFIFVCSLRKFCIIKIKVGYIRPFRKISFPTWMLNVNSQDLPNMLLNANKVNIRSFLKLTCAQILLPSTI